jgi:hypothetical protein
MKGLDSYFRGRLAEYQAELDEQAEEPDAEPCVYCGHDTDENEDCHNPDCEECKA